MIKARMILPFSGFLAILLNARMSSVAQEVFFQYAFAFSIDCINRWRNAGFGMVSQDYKAECRKIKLPGPLPAPGDDEWLPPYLPDRVTLRFCCC